MITWTLVAILGFFLIVVLRELFRKSKTAAKPVAIKPKEDLANLKITDARPGDILSVPGAGDNFGDLEFTVDRRTRYEAGGRRWVELSGMYKERRVSIEAEDADDLVAGASLAPKLTLEDLGMSEDDLSEIDQRQNTADNFEFGEKPWFYRFSKEATLYQDGQPQGRGFYCWKFEEQGGKRWMIIRKFEGEPFDATLVERLNPADITVYRR